MRLPRKRVVWLELLNACSSSNNFNVSVTSSDNSFEEYVNEILNGNQRRNQIYYGTEIIEDEAASREGSMVGTG